MSAPWTRARGAARLEPSAIREILKLTERPGVISLAGGLPSPDGFPVAALREARERVLRERPREALQYAASEGHGPLREWVAAMPATRGLRVAPSQVLMTSGLQSGLDLAAKVLVDAGSRVAVESPTHLGAPQAFASSTRSPRAACSSATCRPAAAGRCRAAASSGCACPTASTPRRCCPGRWREASPTCRTRPSMPTRRSRRHCGCRPPAVAAERIGRGDALPGALLHEELNR